MAGSAASAPATSIDGIADNGGDFFETAPASPGAVSSYHIPARRLSTSFRPAAIPPRPDTRYRALLRHYQENKELDVFELHVHRRPHGRATGARRSVPGQRCRQRRCGTKSLLQSVDTARREVKFVRTPAKKQALLFMAAATSKAATARPICAIPLSHAVGARAISERADLRSSTPSMASRSSRKSSGNNMSKSRVENALEVDP